MALSFDRSANPIVAPDSSRRHWTNPQFRPTETDPRPTALPTRNSLSSLSRRRADREESVLPHAALLANNSHGHLDPMFRRASYQNVPTAAFNRDSISRRSSQHLSYTPKHFDQNKPGFDTRTLIQQNQNYFGYLHTTDNAYTDQYVEEHALSSLSIPSKSAAPALRHSRIALLRQVRRTFATNSDCKELSKRAAIKMSKLYGLQQQQQQQAMSEAHNENRDDWEAKEVQQKAPSKYLYRRDCVGQNTTLSLINTRSRSEKSQYVLATPSNRRPSTNYSDPQARQMRAPNNHATNILSKTPNISRTPNSQRPNMSSHYVQVTPCGLGCESLHSQVEHFGPSNMARHRDHFHGLDPKCKAPVSNTNQTAEENENSNSASGGEQDQNQS